MSIDGLTEAAFVSNPAAAEAAAEAATLPVNGIKPIVTILSVSDITVNFIQFRMLSHSSGCVVDYLVAFTVPSTTVFTPQTLYTQYTQTITANVASGNFTKSLQYKAASVFANATISPASLSFTTFSVKTIVGGIAAPSSRPSSAAPLSRTSSVKDSTPIALIIGVSCGGFALVLFFCVAFFFYRQGSSMLPSAERKAPSSKLSIVPIPPESDLTYDTYRQFQYSPGKEKFVDLERIKTPTSQVRRRSSIQRSEDILSIHYDEPGSPLPDIPPLDEFNRSWRADDGEDNFMSMSQTAERSTTHDESSNDFQLKLGTRRLSKQQLKLEDIIESVRSSPFRDSSPYRVSEKSGKN